MPRRALPAASVAATILALSLAAPAAAAPAAKHTRTGPQILTDAIGAMTRATSFHVDGHSLIAGTKTSVNLSLSANRGGGTIKENGATLQVVVVKKTTVYVKADAHSWQVLSGNPAIASRLANHWVRLPASTAGMANFVKLTVPAEFIHLVLPGIIVGFATKRGVAHWGARKAVVLNLPTGSQFDVADSGIPYLLHMQGPTTTTASYTFTDFGDAPLPSVPVNFIPA